MAKAKAEPALGDEVQIGELWADVIGVSDSGIRVRFRDGDELTYPPDRVTVRQTAKRRGFGPEGLPFVLDPRVFGFQLVDLTLDSGATVPGREVYTDDGIYFQRADADKGWVTVEVHPNG